MKAMSKVTLTLGLMIIVSLFLTSCSGVVTPGINNGNTGNPSSNNPNSNNYQNPSTDPVEESVIEEPEEPAEEPAEEPEEPVEEPEEPAEEPETENPQKWSGLGMMLFSTENTSEFDGYVDALLANGFTELRVNIPHYGGVGDATALRAIAKGANVIWGVCSGGATITSTNWLTFRQAILDAAQWAEDNGVYEFQIGNEEELHVDGTTMTATQIRTNLRDVATEVQGIFTRGKISYSCSYHYVDEWVSEGKGDLDILAGNIYRGGGGFYGDDWKGLITDLVNEFGADGTYLTEFNISGTDVDDYSTDEVVQAAALTEMIEYIKASGMERALFYSWKGDEFGVVKDDGTYRLLWSQALLNTGPVKSTTVSKTTTTISLPDTIALILK
jgi:hypothetical protein